MSADSGISGMRLLNEAFVINNPSLYTGTKRCRADGMMWGYFCRRMFLAVCVIFILYARG